MAEHDFIQPMINEALGAIEDRLGDELGPESGIEIATQLFTHSLAYIAASCEIETRPTQSQLLQFVAYLADGLRETIGTMQGDIVEIRLEVLQDGKRIVRVETHTIKPTADAREVN